MYRSTELNNHLSAIQPLETLYLYNYGIGSESCFDEIRMVGD